MKKPFFTRLLHLLLDTELIDNTKYQDRITIHNNGSIVVTGHRFGYLVCLKDLAIEATDSWLLKTIFLFYPNSMFDKIITDMLKSVEEKSGYTQEVQLVRNNGSDRSRYNDGRMWSLHTNGQVNILHGDSWSFTKCLETAK